MRKTHQRIFEYSVLFLFFVLFVWNISQNFWTLPETGDPLEYLGSVTWDGHFWPWLDRLVLAIGLKSFYPLFTTPAVAGMFYIGFINAAIFLLCLLWSYSRAGFMASLSVGIIFNSSYMMLGYATYIYPNQTETFCSLLAFLFFFAEKNTWKKVLASGFFSAFAAFSKITGIAAPIFFMICILRRRTRGELKTFILGGLLGMLLIFTLFILFYDFQSLLVVFRGCVNRYLTQAIASQLSTNLASFLDILLSPLFFPVFVGSFICLSGYKDKEIRNLYLIGWSYILVIYVIYAFTKRGNLPFPHYIYSSYVYFMVGLAFYISRMFHSKDQTDHSIEKRTKLELLLGLVSFFLIIIGLRIGILYPAALKATSFADIFPQVDIFKPGYGNIIPLPVRLLYLLGPLIVIGSLAIVEYSKSKKWVWVLIISVAIWSSAFNGGIAYRKAYEDRTRADFFYETSPLLREVPAERFSVYVTAWNKNPESYRIPWMYWAVFKERDMDRKPGAISTLEEFRRTTEGIQYISGQGGLRDIQGEYILTNDVETVSKYLLKSVVVKRIERADIVLFVLKKEPMDLGSPVYESDFSNWGRPIRIIGSENDELAPPLNIGVLRGAYRFERLGDKNEDIVRVSLEDRHAKERSCVQFGYYEMGNQGLSLRIKPEDTVVFKIRARLSEGTEATAQVFVQSQDVEWNISSRKILGPGWKEYIVSQKIMETPKKIHVGIWYHSQEKKEYLEIQSPEIYVLRSRKTNLD